MPSRSTTKATATTSARTATAATRLASTLAQPLAASARFADADAALTPPPHPKAFQFAAVHARLRRLHVIARHISSSSSSSSSSPAPAPSAASASRLAARTAGAWLDGDAAGLGAALQLVPLPGTVPYAAWLDALHLEKDSLFADWTQGFYSSRAREAALRRLAALVRHLSDRPLIQEVD